MAEANADSEDPNRDFGQEAEDQAETNAPTPTPGHWETHLRNGILPGVPLFPLPNVVLLPGALLPLHIFEKRYRSMTCDALGVEGNEDGRCLICMCRVRAGHDPMDDQPALYDVGCVGRVVDYEPFADGRSNLLLKGLARVRISREYRLGESHDDARIYRRADLKPLTSERAYEIDLVELRDQMRRLCNRPPIAGTPVARQLERLFASDVPTGKLADILAFDLIEDIDAKQNILEKVCERGRVEMIARCLDLQFPAPDSLSCLENRFRDETA